jgi:hypothetical protein
MRRAGYVVLTGEMRNVYKILVGKVEQKRSLGSPGHRLNYIIEVDLK